MQNLPLHSPVGGSGMGRWHKDRCPGSVSIARHYKDISSYEAEEGTSAHELAATCLLTGLNAGDYHGHIFNGISVDDEMVVGVQSYLDLIREEHVRSSMREIELLLPCECVVGRRWLWIIRLWCRSS